VHALEAQLLQALAHRQAGGGGGAGRPHLYQDNGVDDDDNG
jgi:hypothetical protein